LGPVSIRSERHQYFKDLEAIARLQQVFEQTAATIGDPVFGHLGALDSVGGGACAGGYSM
jgi:hypothetical protein